MATRRSFPRSTMETSRRELKDAPITVFEGIWPKDLRGHYYWMAPVGNPRDGAPPWSGSKPRPSVINGDGMVYRFDLEAQTVSCAIVKTPDWWADQITSTNPRYRDLRFEDAGILRFSLALGARNFANTALVPMTTPGQPPRLLVTYDPARPVEIDPITLETLSCVGKVEEYRAELPAIQPFPTTLTTAHPFYDSHTEELFLVNWGRSMSSMAGTLPGMRGVAAARRLGALALWKFLNVLWVDTDPDSGLRRLLDRLSGWPAELLARLDVDIPADFVYVMRWDGEGELERWRVTLPDGRFAFIEESVHQVAATRDYVILMDTSFKLDVDSFLFYRDLRSLIDAFVPAPLRPLAYTLIPTRLGATFDRLLRVLTATPQKSKTVLYLVPRAELVNGRTGPEHGDEEEPTVVARRVVMDLEAVHFLADYENPDDTLRVHIGHGCSQDLAEWLHAYDRSIYTAGTLPKALEGLVASEVDISRLGCYEIEGSTGLIKRSRVQSEDPHTWGIALYAARNVPPWEAPPARLSSVYWFTFGFWPETLSNFIYDMYADYPNRQVALERIRALDQEDGRPCVLFRLDTEGMQIADAYVFDNTSLCSSPQFVPRPNTTGDTEGYILCTLWTDSAQSGTDQIWVFDASNLSQGPVCKVRSDALQFGFSLHSAYLPQAEPHNSPPYRVDGREDYAARVRGKLLEALFEEIYESC